MEKYDDDQSRYWAGLIAEQKSSGLTVSNFCRDRGVSVHVYRAWRTRLNKQLSANGGWAVLKPQRAPVPSSSIALRIGSVNIDLSAGFDADLLREVVAALSAC